MQALGTAMVYLHRYPEAAEIFRDAIEKGVPGLSGRHYHRGETSFVRGY